MTTQRTFDEIYFKNLAQRVKEYRDLNKYASTAQIVKALGTSRNTLLRLQKSGRIDLPARMSRSIAGTKSNALRKKARGWQEPRRQS